MPRKTKHNDITNPELLKQVNPENMQLMDDFLDYLRSIQRSEGTVDGYRSDLSIAFVWNLKYNNNAFYCDWTKRNIIKYQNWLLNENGNSPARIRRLKAALSSLGGFVENILDDEYPDFRNIINKVESPINQPVREKTVWKDEELQDLLNKLVELKAYDKACYLALAMYSGRRKSELCRFKVSDFDDSRLVCGGALYKSAPIKTKGRSGGKYVPCYVLAKRFKPYFDLWMNARREYGIESEWLFPVKTAPDKHIPISTANSWANTYSRLSGRHAYPHSLRHFFTSELSRAGIPDRVIQDIQHWTSGDMVRIYIDSDTDEELEKYFCEDGIKKVETKGLSDL